MKLKLIGTLVAAVMLIGFIPALSGCSTETSIYYTLYDDDDEAVNTYYYSEDPAADDIEEVGAEDGYYYMVSGYSGKPKNLVIPATIGGVQVKGIEKQAFANCSSLITVEIEEGVETAGQAAFVWCQALVSVSIPSTMNIADGMFGMCVLLQSVTIAEGVTSIGNMAFEWCFSLSEVNANKESSFNLPSTITSIGGYAFFDCYALNGSIVIPDGVETIKEYAFAQADDDWYSSYYSEFVSELGSITSIVLGSGVTEIGEGAFGGLSDVVLVSLSNSLAKIGDGAFAYCTSLTSINIPYSVEFIGTSAFEGCELLTSVNFEGSSRVGYLYEEELDEDEDPTSSDDDVIDKRFTDYHYYDDSTPSHYGYVPYTVISDATAVAALLTGDCYEAYWYLVPYSG